jgi:hypothetical protein
MNEYADAIHAGAKMPPVTVFFDGVDHWLADGFHRLLARMDQYLEDIEAEVIHGSLVQAKLYAYGANQHHGLRRTNDDKRKAVAGVAEIASDWSDRQIAAHVGVSHSFVSAVRNPEVAERQQQNRERSADKKRSHVESDSTDSDSSTRGAAGVVAPHADQALASDSAAVVIEPSPHAHAAEDSLQVDFGPGKEELAYLEAQEQVDREKYDQLVEIAHADDKLGEALKQIDIQSKEVARLRAEITVLRERNTGLMNEKVMLEATAKRWKRIAEQHGYSDKRAK